RRGHIYITAHLSNTNIFEGSITPAMTVIDSYMKAMQSIKTTYSLTDDIKLDNILRLPNVFSKDEQPLNETATQQILAAVTELINKVIEDRAEEGNRLAVDLDKRIGIIKS